jgi:hypothetical protein
MKIFEQQYAEDVLTTLGEVVQTSLSIVNQKHRREWAARFFIMAFKIHSRRLDIYMRRNDLRFVMKRYEAFNRLLEKHKRWNRYLDDSSLQLELIRKQIFANLLGDENRAEYYCGEKATIEDRWSKVLDLTGEYFQPFVGPGHIREQLSLKLYTNFEELADDFGYVYEEGTIKKLKHLANRKKQ